MTQLIAAKHNQILHIAYTYVLTEIEYPSLQSGYKASKRLGLWWRIEMGSKCASTSLSDVVDSREWLAVALDNPWNDSDKDRHLTC